MRAAHGARSAENRTAPGERGGVTPFTLAGGRSVERVLELLGRRVRLSCTAWCERIILDGYSDWLRRQEMLADDAMHRSRGRLMAWRTAGCRATRGNSLDLKRA